MKNISILISLIFLLKLNVIIGATDPQLAWDDLKNELNILMSKRNAELKSLADSLKVLEYNLALDIMPVESSIKHILAMRSIDRKIVAIENCYQLKVTKLRYGKGLDVLKLVYEKILSLDHHFTTLRSFQDITDLSNPINYPEFIQIKESIKEKTKSKEKIELPPLLESNPLVALTHTVIASLFGSGNKTKRKQEYDAIACMLDFTTTMHTNLKLIYFETDFLKQRNTKLRETCLQLFHDYTKVIKYNKSLEYCRNIDDWDKINALLSSFVNQLEIQCLNIDVSQQKTFKLKLNNLEFSIERLLRFLNSYSSFVDQGERYYKKFMTIIQSYENKKNCEVVLPNQFIDLENEIVISIQKFETAYKIAELRGTTLRDLLYGIPE